MRRLGVIAIVATMLLGACSEAEPGPERRGDAPVPPSSGRLPGPSVEVPIQVSGPGLSRPLPLDQITNVFLNAYFDPSYTPDAPYNDPAIYAAALTWPLTLELRKMGRWAQMPPVSEACGGCTPSGHVDVRISRPKPDVHRIVVNLRTPHGARTWTVERADSNLYLTDAEREGGRHSELHRSIGNDLVRIGQQVCRTLTARPCKEP